MKQVKYVLLIVVLVFIGVITGCQNCEKTSPECLEAYEKVEYNFTGDLPPECLKSNEKEQ